jgi:AraC-like DNA-binding protein
MQKIEYSSDELPRSLNDGARFRLWCEMWEEQLGAAEMKHASDKPFATSSKVVLFEGLSVAKFATSVEHYVRTRKHVANDRDDIYVGFYRSPKPQIWSAGTRELSMQAGTVIAYNLAQPCQSLTNGMTSWLLVSIPREQIVKLVPDAYDRRVALLDRNSPAVRHLERTAEFLLASDEISQSPAISRNAGAMLSDLLALALGAEGEAAEFATARGMRAARLREVIAMIEARFADPGLSTEVVAGGLGVSRRYVNDLLLESGETFAERVLELRLRKARAMLSDVRHDGTRVSDIALACGFNEVSYFNRRFRARFGCSPTHYRGRQE